VPALVEESRRAGMTVALDFQVGDAAPAAVGRTAYRIVQEGLTNARKHARGARVSVTVRAEPGGGLHVELRNPCPQDSAGIPGAGAGLIGLAERARLAGGRLEHGRAGEEFTLRAWLPWPA
jgi:signal transduction histidine kinase